MRNRRKNWILRRLVLGFAVAAIAAPVAQARVERVEGGSGGHSQQSAFIPWVTDFGGSGSTASEGLPARGDDKVVNVQPTSGLPVRGDDKVLNLEPRFGLPVRGDDKVLNLEPTVGAQYNQFAYRHALPSDYGVQPVQISSKADGFDWNDAGIGAGLAFGLMLLLAGATLGTRHISRPASI